MSRTSTQFDLDRFVRNNVLCGLSSMVSTLASGSCVEYGLSQRLSRPTDRELALRDLVDQAMELASPVYDYEGAARQDGWSFVEYQRDRCMVFRHSDGRVNYNTTWTELCDEQDIEPYEREVFEFWAVDSWFAEKLIAQGEKVDTDFAGLCVWARTTSGQAISMDGVIERIWRDLHKDDA